MLHFKWQKLFHTNYHKIGQTFEYKCHCGGKICVKQNYFSLEFFIFLLTIIINFWKIFIGYTTWLTFSLKQYDFFIGTNIWKKSSHINNLSFNSIHNCNGKRKKFEYFNHQMVKKWIIYYTIYYVQIMAYIPLV